ncbi:MAG: hypothetical protein V3V08_23685 [Nannocystaceae bacterium]
MSNRPGLRTLIKGELLDVEFGVRRALDDEWAQQMMPRSEHALYTTVKSPLARAHTTIEASYAEEGPSSQCLSAR